MVGRPPSVSYDGKKFGELTAVKSLGIENSRMRWLFLCSCGTFVSREARKVFDSWRKGSACNCGCKTKLIRSANGMANATHGLSVIDRRLYDVHRQMINRCENSGSKDYSYYGGRGISVCDEWQDPAVFFDWAYSSGYRANLTIERKDVNGGYHPDNCTWVPNEEQSHNTRRNVKISIDGTTKHLAAWARDFGIKWPTVADRLRRGWDAHRAVTTPVAGASA
jgi:hypothetical protein